MLPPDLELMKQVWMGNVAGIERSLRAGANVDGCEELEYLRPLLVAARLDHLEAIKALARAGCDVNSASLSDPPDDTDVPWDGMLDPRLSFAEGTHALHAATLGRSLKGVKLLLELGADCNAADCHGRTPLCPAFVCVSKDRRIGTAIVRALLDAGADPSRMSDPHGTTLHYALNEDAPDDVINMLVAKSPATLNLPDNKGFTPLARAVFEGDGRVVSCLLSAGATDKDVLSEYGICSLYAAVQTGKENVFSLLVDHGIKEVVGVEAIPRALIYAAQFKRVKMLRVLLGLEEKVRREKRARRDSAKNLGLLRHAVRYGAWRPYGAEAFQASLATIHILLSTGTHVEDAGEVIGVNLPAHQRDPQKEAAISRMLERASAFRARSWAWPCQSDDTRAFGRDLGTTRAQRSRTSKSSLRVRIVRPMRMGVVAACFARYSRK